MSVNGRMGGPSFGNIHPYSGGQFTNGYDNRPQIPQVQNPCDLNGPVLQGSNWPVEVAVYPSAARPIYGKTFVLYSEVEVPITGVWVEVIGIRTDQSEEGRVLQWAGEEEGAVGSDLFWRITVNGSSPARYDVMRGGWSSIAVPKTIATPIPTGQRVALQVFLSVAGPSPRTVRATMIGWTAPFDGGGTFAGGFAR